MNSKKLFPLAVLLCLCAFQIAPAQDQGEEVGNSTAVPAIRETIKIDEFSRVSDCDLGARMDAARIALSEDSGAKAYFITYRGTEDVAANRTGSFVQSFQRRIQRQMAFSRMDESRVELIDGGFRQSEYVSTEVWIMPEGGIVPTPSETVEKPKSPKDKAYKFTETYLNVQETAIETEPVIDEETEFIPESEVEETAEPQAEEAIAEEPFEEESEEVVEEEYDEYFWFNDDLTALFESDKTITGTLIFYADDQNYHIEKIRQSIEEHLQKKYEKTNFDSSRVKIVFGGYRENEEIEFWIVPKKAVEPVPTPQERKPVEQESE